MTARDWPMERKFLLGSLAVALTAIAFVSVFLILTELKLVRGERAANTNALVGMIAGNAAAALVYDDRDVARQILARAAAEPGTRASALYDAEGRLYAWYPESLPRDALPPVAGKPRLEFTADRLVAFAAVTANGRPVGTAYISTDLTATQERMRLFIWTVAAAATLAVLLSILLSRKIQRGITRPLLRLSGTAKRIAAEGNYTIRARKESADEVGELVDAFNQMVEEVGVSHRKIQEHAASLERIVDERTARLRETIGELEAFSYSISHDMRTPLRAMHGYAELLLKDYGARLDEPGVRFLARISQNATRLDLLVRDVLAYSRVAREQVELAPVALDVFVPALVAQMAELQRPELQLSLRRPLPEVLAHEAYLSQIFNNLLGNAVKFMPPGVTPVIELSAESGDGFAKIIVKDNGIGIDPAHFIRIFEIFGRVYPERQYEGTGIGLTIVKKAVQRMGGAVGVESALGQGARFWFTLRTP